MLSTKRTEQEKLKIFVSAYACEPGMGSEIGVGWHWVLEMSKYFELWVLTRESNRHTIEPWINKHPEYNHIHWLYFDLPQWTRWWKKGLRGVRTYYNIWQYATNHIVRKTMQENHIQIFHHLTYGNALWKVSKYGQKQFFVWGPIGGLETIPKEFSCHYDWKSRLIETIRRLTVRISPYNRGLKYRCKHADLILCKTDITRNALPLPDREKTVLFTDVATELLPTAQETKNNATPSATEFICIGRLDAWRGFDLAIEALAEASTINENIHLTIVGDGSDKKRLFSLIHRFGLQEKVKMAGKVSREEYLRLMDEADVVVNASLKEGAVTVSFDAMSMGKPLICLDTTGYTRHFSNKYAHVIPCHKRKDVIACIKDSMLQLTDSELRRRMGQEALSAAQKLSWEQHGKDIRDAILTAYQKRTSPDDIPASATNS